MIRLIPAGLLTVLFLCHSIHVSARTPGPFRAIAFFKGVNDQAHISFVQEANEWFGRHIDSAMYGYDTTTNWDNLNDSFLRDYQVVLFLDARPDKPSQREAFRRYMERGGAWMGFHFAAFALTPSLFPQDWDWYHNEFLGSGSYVSNTWRPTSAIIKMEGKGGMQTPDTFHSAPNEWYCWEKDLRKNPDIRIIASIDPRSFPLGTGPKPHEIWQEGYYPVIWTNRKYRMVYFNMGHNDIDYEGGTNRTLSKTFSASPFQALLTLRLFLQLGDPGGSPLE
ncbi:MAG: ThuA domain-containing protein [Chitinophagaceae bacterium]|nr:MAG: ThuA domain-containing protein [Chitinophagaceae bacterium]